MKTLLAAALFTAAVQTPQVLPGGKTFEESGREVDSFIGRTFDRISVAWGMCKEEFRLASETAVDESKEAVMKNVEAARMSVEEGVRDAIQEKVDETLEGGNAVPHDADKSE